MPRLTAGLALDFFLMRASFTLLFHRLRRGLVSVPPPSLHVPKFPVFIASAVIEALLLIDKSGISLKSKPNTQIG